MNMTALNTMGERTYFLHLRRVSRRRRKVLKLQKLLFTTFLSLKHQAQFEEIRTTATPDCITAIVGGHSLLLDALSRQKHIVDGKEFLLLNDRRLCLGNLSWSCFRNLVLIKNAHLVRNDHYFDQFIAYHYQNSKHIILTFESDEQARETLNKYQFRIYNFS